MHSHDRHERDECVIHPLAGVLGASAIVMSFQLLGYFKPEWKHPVLYVVNAAALVAAVWCGVKLYRERDARRALSN